MTFPPNSPHERRFADPDSRPSNELTDPVVEHTRWRVRELECWLDELAVVGEAEALLRGPRRVVRGDPGE